MPVAGLVLTLGAPLWIGLALMVRLTSQGPALHRAIRIGQGGKPFTLLKYRSMRIGLGPTLTAGSDPRITGIGRLLRLSKLDEVPQLINVLRGEMSIVGPRPEDPSFIRWQDPVQLQVLSARPGLTSRASVVYRHEERILAEAKDVERIYREEVLPAKLALDAEWLASRTVCADIRIVFDTAAALVRFGASAMTSV